MYNQAVDMGSSRNCLQRTVRNSQIIVIVAILICLWGGACEGTWADDTQAGRLVIYHGEIKSDPPYGLPYENLVLPENVTIRYSSPELGFIVVDVPGDKQNWYKNEILKVPWVSGVEFDAVRSAKSIDGVPDNDPYYPDQWSLNRSRVDEAWSIINNPVPPIVALIDTGVDMEHPDLNGVIIQGGYDWVEDDSYPQDTDGHGTHLAGIIGAVHGNSQGILGVAPVKILVERIGTNGSDMRASSSALALRHAADSGARIILMGYGGTEPSFAEERGIKYASSKGCILIAPAGNEATNSQHYPSDDFEVISVGSTAKTDGLSYFSNYGIFVELVAPGEDIISTWPGNSYQRASGTSQSAALVTGITALALSADPSLSRENVRSLLGSTARDLGKTGRDIYYGFGLVDAKSTVQKLLSQSKDSSKIGAGDEIYEVKSGSEVEFKPEIEGFTPPSINSPSATDIKRKIDGFSPSIVQNPVSILKEIENRKRSDGQGAIPSAELRNELKPTIPKPSSQNKNLIDAPGIADKFSSINSDDQVQTLTLGPGWNFISLPFELNASIYSLFQDLQTDGHTIWAFEGKTGYWTAVDGNKKIPAYKGLLVYSRGSDSINIANMLSSESSKIINLNTGWNLVGFPMNSPEKADVSLKSLSDAWVYLISFNNIRQSYEPAIIQGASGSHADSRDLYPNTAYWIYMSRNATFWE